MQTKPTNKIFSEYNHHLLMKTKGGAWINVCNYTIQELNYFGIDSITEFYVSQKHEQSVPMVRRIKYSILYNELNSNRAKIYSFSKDGIDLIPIIPE